MAKLLDEIHPGEILLEEFMKPMGITARKLAADIDVSPSRISELVHGARCYSRHCLASGLVLRHGAALLAESAERVRHADRNARFERSDRTAHSGASPGAS